MGVWPWDATDKPELISIKWENGIPTKINGDNYSLVEVFKLLNNLVHIIYLQMVLKYLG